MKKVRGFTLIELLVVPRHRDSRRAFTLIELLVVIAIIAILAAILFPVFAKAHFLDATDVGTFQASPEIWCSYSFDVRTPCTGTAGQPPQTGPCSGCRMTPSCMCSRISLRHNNGFIVTYVDGHAKWIQNFDLASKPWCQDDRPRTTGTGCP